jgi:hypothetical protein
MTLTDEQRAKVERLIAEHLFGWIKWRSQLGSEYFGPEYGSHRDPPPYTTSGDAMLEVIEKMRTRPGEFPDFIHALQLRAGVSDFKSIAGWLFGEADVSLEVALAALSAVGVDWRAECGVKEESR